MTVTAEEHRRMYLQALRNGARMPENWEREKLMDQARKLVAERSRGAASAEASTDTSPGPRREWLDPRCVAVNARHLLGLHGEIHRLSYQLDDARASNERLQRLVYAASAGVLGAVEVDLGKLEQALETGHGLPRDAEKQLLEVVRELMRWRESAGR